MTLDQIQASIKACFEQMRVRYDGNVVFDEWAVVSLANDRARVLVYSGPRKDGFKKNFAIDAAALRAGLLERDRPVGDFEFNRQGVGTGFEAFIRLGSDLYLICNNTAQTMDAIAGNPSWIHAQVPFRELPERVRQDPVPT